MPGFALRNPYLIIVGALIITLLGATLMYGKCGTLLG